MNTRNVQIIWNKAILNQMHRDNYLTTEKDHTLDHYVSICQVKHTHIRCENPWEGGRNVMFIHISGCILVGDQHIAPLTLIESLVHDLFLLIINLSMSRARFYLWMPVDQPQFTLADPLLTWLRDLLHWLCDLGTLLMATFSCFYGGFFTDDSLVACKEWGDIGKGVFTLPAESISFFSPIFFNYCHYKGNEIVMGKGRMCWFCHSQTDIKDKHK